MGHLDDLDAEERSRRAAIVRGMGGVQPMHLVFYARSIRYSARAAASAFERFSSAPTSLSSPEAIISAVQEGLTHAAALSRFFWPPSTKGELGKLAVARGIYLREHFAVTDDSPLASRSLRNAIEHYDERLDEFFLQDPVGILLPDPLIEHHSIADEATGHVFRALDPVSGIVILLGQKFEFFPIREEVMKILKRSDDS